MVTLRPFTPHNLTTPNTRRASCRMALTACPRALSTAFRWPFAHAATWASCMASQWVLFIFVFIVLIYVIVVRWVRVQRKPCGWQKYKHTNMQTHGKFVIGSISTHTFLRSYIVTHLHITPRIHLNNPRRPYQPLVRFFWSGHRGRAAERARGCVGCAVAGKNVIASQQLKSRYFAQVRETCARYSILKVRTLYLSSFIKQWCIQLQFS